jgi:hypothetical protein
VGAARARSRARGRIGIGIRIRTRCRFRVSARSVRNAGWSNFVWIVLVRRNGGWLNREASSGKRNRAKSENSAKPATHGREISGKDSIRASG